MDAELHSLRIDRQHKHGTHAGRGWLSWTFLAVLLLAVLVAAGAVILRRDGAVPVEVVLVQKASAAAPGAPGAVALNATGYIVAAHRVELAPKVVGRVKWIGVEMADKVEKDQELVKLEDEEYVARRMQALGQLELASARLEELVNGARPEEKEKSKAELNRAEVELAHLQAKLKRAQGLAATGAVADQDLEEAQAAFDAQNALVISLQKAHRLVELGPRIEQINAQKAQVDQAQGIYNAAQIDLDNTVIKAPLNGTILERNVEVGEYVTTGFVSAGGAKGYVVAIADLNDLRVELDISQNDFARVQRAQPCRVTTDAYPDRKYEGIVDLIAPQANRQKATILVKVRIVNPDEYLRPDMNASVAFLNPGAPAGGAQGQPAGAGAGGTVAVPASAIRDGAVFVVVAGRAQRLAVEAGAQTRAGTEIRRGLSGGESLIVNPPADLQDGQAVRVQEH
jgi:HlyD family secretion protein